MLRSITIEKELTHIDLFSGIGGFTLAAEWAGFKTVVFCEKEKFCQRVLQKRFGAIIADSKSSGRASWSSKGQPGRCNSIPIIEEIRDFDGTKYRGAALLTGGFPCQPFSVAGQRRGKEDDRYLWPEMRRVIGEAKPRWILAENVPGIFRMALDTVLADLEGEGYTTGTFIIPACSLNAPHRRNRIWIIGHSSRSRRQQESWSSPENESQNERWSKIQTDFSSSSNSNACNTSSNRHQERLEKARRTKRKSEQGGMCESERTNSDVADSAGKRKKPISQQRQRSGIEPADSHASDSTRGRQLKCLSKREEKGNFSEGDKHEFWQENWHEVATRFCRVDDGVPDRVHRLKALGNAIVPQIALQILKNIAWIEREIA